MAKEAEEKRNKLDQHTKREQTLPIHSIKLIVSLLLIVIILFHYFDHLQALHIFFGVFIIFVWFLLCCCKFISKIKILYWLSHKLPKVKCDLIGVCLVKSVVLDSQSLTRYGISDVVLTTNSRYQLPVPNQ